MDDFDLKGLLKLYAGVILAMILTALVVGSLTSCSVQKSIAQTKESELDLQRILYELTMQRMSRYTTDTTTTTDSIGEVMKRRVVVYDNSMAIKDESTGEWSAPVAMVVEEEKKRDSVKVEEKRVETEEEECVTELVEEKTDSVDVRKEVVTEKRKNGTSTARLAVLGFVLGCVMTAVVILRVSNIWRYR